jgi:hypothetical protein
MERLRQTLAKYPIERLVRAQYVKKQQGTIRTVLPLDNRYRMSLALDVSKCLFLLVQVH